MFISHRSGDKVDRRRELTPDVSEIDRAKSSTPAIVDKPMADAFMQVRMMQAMRKKTSKLINLE